MQKANAVWQFKLNHKHLARQAAEATPHADLLRKPLWALTWDSLSLN